ncbi:hypothetical protein CR513_20722, partial [Mucuna pruriens]
MSVSSYYAKLHSLSDSLYKLKLAHSCMCDGIKLGVIITKWIMLCNFSWKRSNKKLVHILIAMSQASAVPRKTTSFVSTVELLAILKIGAISSMVIHLITRRTKLLQEQTSTTIIMHHHASNDFAFSTSSFDSLHNCWPVDSEEKQQEISASTSSDVSYTFAITIASSNKRKGTKKDHPLSVHYGILGHTRDQCYKFHGYPPNYKKNKHSQCMLITIVSILTKSFSSIREIGASTSSNVSHAFTITTASNNKLKATKKVHHLCAHCGILGHTRDCCYKFHGYPPNYKKNKVSSESVNQVSTPSTTPYF